MPLRRFCWPSRSSPCCFPGAPLRLPRIKLPLALFLLGTLIAWAFSGNMTVGLPQIRKIYVFCELLVVFSALRDMALIRWLFLTWAAFGGIAAGWGLVQFAQKVQQARCSRATAIRFISASASPAS